MNRIFLLALMFFSRSLLAQDFPTEVQMSVWVNEAVVSTYTYSFTNYLERQKEIAKYFSAEGWKAYSEALIASQLPEMVAKNKYYVSAVATRPPEIKKLTGNNWQAVLPLLVSYKNPQYQQIQTLKVTLTFSPAPAGQGVRGFVLTSLQAQKDTVPCICKPEN